VRRTAFLAALAAGAALAPSAAALAPPVPSGSAIGEGVPLKAYATLSPPVNLFGDPITAHVSVVADTKWVDPKRLRVTTDFRPFVPVSQPQVVRVGHGRFEQITWTWTLSCLTAKCVPSSQPTDILRTFRIRPAEIDYLTLGGSRAYGLRAYFPAVRTLSHLSAGVVQELAQNHALAWRYTLAPVAAPRYRVSPTLLYRLALGLGIALAVAAALLAGRWALALRALRGSAERRGTPLERALDLLVWARARGDDTLERKALERVADELRPDVVELSETARALAWSRERPGDDDLAAISEGARRARRAEEQPPELKR